MQIGIQQSPRLTAPSPRAASSAPAAAPAESFTASFGPDDLKAAMAELKAASSRPYYDETGDASKREKYYKDIPANASPGELFSALHDKVSDTHTRPQGYKPSTHLYPWIDLRPNLELQSIYSGQSMSAAGAIQNDFENQRKLDEKIAQIATRTSWAPEVAATAIAFAEAQFALNCEHVVPQSWFGKKEPMRGDMHHLFACETRCNSYRGNKNYDEIDQASQQAVPDQCGIAKDQRFEPQANKGIVARATLYFLLRYPGQADEYSPKDIELLKKWSKDQPVTLYEKHRNAAIEEAQGNRNPLIDHPEWADKIDFTAGLKKP